jgi:hypothetical protein
VSKLIVTYLQYTTIDRARQDDYNGGIIKIFRQNQDNHLMLPIIMLGSSKSLSLLDLFLLVARLRRRVVAVEPELPPTML